MSHKHNHHKTGSRSLSKLEYKSLYHLSHNSYEYRNLDGSGNNKKNPNYGKSRQPFLRKIAAAYNNNDGCSLNDLNGTRPNPRTISNSIFKQDKSIPNEQCLSNIFWVWGQFIDHDVTLTHTTDEKAHIPVESKEDPLYPMIPFSRSESVPDDQECNPENPRRQINSLTPFIDASNVYGSSLERNKYIREFCGGRLKTICDNLPPYNDSTMDNGGPGFGPNFVCGDVRANENFGLASMHTLFVREHNYWANKLAEKYPCKSDEEIYQRAKVMVESEIEAITFNEFLPTLLGRNEISAYSYNSDTNPQISTEFSTAAYRFAHSMIPTNVLKDIKLKDMFFASHFISNEHISIDEILKQLSKGVAEKFDSQVIDDLRSFLFGQPGQGGSDLVSLNIQRGRDHGIALINDLLEACNLPTISTWSDITSDVNVQNKLEQLYVKPEDIDAWVFGLVQKPDPEKESIVSPLFHEIIKDGFTRLRDGDRLWYENRLSCYQIKLVNKTRLSDIIRRNTCNIEIDDNAFIVKKCLDRKCKPHDKCCCSCKPKNELCKPKNKSYYTSSDSSDSDSSNSDYKYSQCYKPKHKTKKKCHKKRKSVLYLKRHKKRDNYCKC